MKTPDGHCQRFGELIEGALVGRVLSGEDRRFVAAHVERCSDCRLESRLHEEMEFDGTSCPAPELDDLARRRWVDEVLERTRAAEDGARGAQTRRWPIPLFAAAAATVIAGVAAALFFGVGSWDEAGETAPSPTAIEPAGARLLMASGDVYQGGQPLSIGAKLRGGDRLYAPEGDAVFSLRPGVMLHFDAQTRARIVQNDGRASEVFVELGRIVASVDPAVSGPQLVISTAEGRVVVTGTVFSVAVDEDCSRVAVFRGSVRLEDGAMVRRIRVGEEAVFGDGAVFQFDREQEQGVLGVLAAMQLLSEDGGAAVELESLPTGADVELDGVWLGRTPLTAFVREGHRKLEMSKDGYESVRELLRLSRRSELTRMFELGVGGASAPDDARCEDEAAKPSGTVRMPGAKPQGESAASMLARAQAFRAQRNWLDAVETCQELLRRHPTSYEAMTARVSMGSIQLEKLHRPAQALESFEAYLATGARSTLAQEAAFGRAQALRAMGQTAREREALRGFLRDYPDAIQIPGVRARLDELE